MSPGDEATHETLTGPRCAARWAEMIGVFFGLPALVALFVDPARRLDTALASVGIAELTPPGFKRFTVMLPILILFSIVIAFVLVFARSFPTRKLWNWGDCRVELPRIVGWFVLGAVLLLGLAYALHTWTDVMLVRSRGGEVGSTFLNLPRNNLPLIIAIGLIYPWFSAYPQEITHRAFFFHRYRPILPGRWSMIGVSAVAFAWLHAPFWNWIALAITLPGGVLFAWTYDRTQSALAAGIEHGLYGWWCFFTGLGFFVYAGSLGA